MESWGIERINYLILPDFIWIKSQNKLLDAHCSIDLCDGAGFGFFSFDWGDFEEKGVGCFLLLPISA